MTRPTVVRKLFLAALVAAVSLMPRVAAAQDDAFKEGMKAFDDKKWSEAAELMRKAIQASGQDSQRSIEYGGVLGVRKKNTKYVPHYYLGFALYKRDDCAGAVTEWAIAEKQGPVNGTPDFVRDMQEGFAFCETRGVLPPPKYDPTLQRTTRHYEEVRGLATTLSNQGKDSPTEFQEVRDQYASASAELTAGASAIGAATRTRSQKDFDSANAAIDRAQNILVTAQTKFSALIGERGVALALAKEVEGLLAKGDEIERQANTRVSDKKAPLAGSLTTIRETGRDALSKARERYVTGSKGFNVAVLNDAKAQATNGTNAYRQLLDELNRLDGAELQNAVTGAEQALLLFDGLIGTFGKRTAANPSLADGAVTTERDQIVKEVDGARRRLAAAKSTSSLDGINRARNATVAATDRLSALLSRFGPLTLRERGVTEALEEGSRQFFAGQYDKALAALSAPEALAPDVPLQLHVHLFRAASLHAQYARSPKDEALRKQALAEVAECRRLDSAFEPDRRAFSPGFIKFFKAEHAPPAAGGQ